MTRLYSLEFCPSYYVNVASSNSVRSVTPPAIERTLKLRRVVYRGLGRIVHEEDKKAFCWMALQSPRGVVNWMVHARLPKTAFEVSM